MQLAKLRELAAKIVELELEALLAWSGGHEWHLPKEDDVETEGMSAKSDDGDDEEEDDGWGKAPPIPVRDDAPHETLLDWPEMVAALKIPSVTGVLILPLMSTRLLRTILIAAAQEGQEKSLLVREVEMPSFFRGSGNPTPPARRMSVGMFERYLISLQKQLTVSAVLTTQEVNAAIRQSAKCGLEDE